MHRISLNLMLVAALAALAPACGDSEDPSYPEEPHGFVSSTVVTATNNPVWDGGGDVIPNICLPNQRDDVRCLDEYWQSEETQLLFVDFSAVWCGVCQMAATDEPAIIANLAARGWNAEWITVLFENADRGKPAAFDASNWKNGFASSGDVLYDAEWIWHEEPWLDKRPEEDRTAQPLIFVVDTATMEIWLAFPGYSPDWATEAGTDWFIEKFNEYSQY